MENKNYENKTDLYVIEELGIAYSYCKIVLSDNRKICDWIFIKINKGFEKFIGILKEKIENRRASEIEYLDNYREFILKELNNMWNNKLSDTEFEYYFIEKNNWIKVYLRKYKRKYFFLILNNISEYKIREIVLKSKEKIYKSIVESSSNAVIIRNIYGRFLYFNNSACNLFGYTEEEMRRLNVRDIIPYNENIEMYYPIEDKFLEKVYRKKDGTNFYTEEVCKFINMEGEVAIISYIKDITEIKKFRDETSHMAYFDGLTDLPNRNRFYREINNELKENKCFAIIFLDLDKFKNINDMYGHCIGDKILCVVSSRIKNILKKGDIIARFGGDEFIILLKNIKDKCKVKKVVLKILESFKEDINLDGENINVKISIGISFFPDDGQDIKTLIDNADKAMYKAKKLGKDKFVIYSKNQTLY
ncbi:diguanylate cyclase [Clostridium niameyense]|uniref:Diguanylate cyclase n=1 Tax=Clostridium niameyense TaxID=1622073 RepID=A0A6M0RAW1_9CLOT|nr:sensor domain-containing diguanylate cyclase [Clostridium niameyense]NEZ46887.1 diguanylate cyclase [Clostridium niameyense]